MKVIANWNKDQKQFDDLAIGECFRIGDVADIYVKTEVFHPDDTYSHMAINLTNSETYAINYDAIVAPTSGAFVENYEDLIACHLERCNELESANNKLRAELASVNDEVRTAKNNVYDLFRKLADVVEPEVTHFSSDPLVNDPEQLVSMVIDLLKQRVE